MMILLLYAVLFCVSFVRASSLKDTSIHTLDTGNSPSYNSRTLLDILSSCGLTLFASTWTAVHPNIPGVEDGVVLTTFYRLCLMVIALFVPESMTALAAMQFLSARKATKDFNRAFGAQYAHDRRATWQSELAVALIGDIPNSSRSSSAEWTLTHGFFACMGGFVLYIDGEPRATLNPDELIRFVREGSVKIPVITEADIEDRSKGDVISKGVAILQLVWFVIQLIARYTQDLPVTLLEIDTLGVVALACIAYIFWWKKPKDIGRPYIVHWNSRTTAPPPRGSLTNKYHSGKRRSFVLPSLGANDGSLFGPHRAGIVSLITGCVSGMVFGGIHCLGWNFLFPRHTEQTLWRVASTGMTCSPLMFTSMFATALLMDILELEFGLQLITSRESPPIFYIFLFFGGAVNTLSAYLYIFARVTVIVLMFMSLRSLPPGAYYKVAWTDFIPHINL
ncbi:hypothetical protein CY34DRAFT_805141 [Suillus luteus UH-Slu-Lm8-n1]|uniref:Uncharacterized protein n=1 Tax=Suillus luteus UH-Slu-Lm8-n1 TaxID=930992 RepID=A0A0D0B6Y3_9AGAM|nr:hypothetical protein CY34DRAFT_805141 [Suillus luteus UH-Slu-Lm8-n1]